MLSVRVNADERALLEDAARDSGATLSDFVRRKSVEAAEQEILNRSRVVIPAEHWDSFEAWLAEPPKPNPKLAQLMLVVPVWER